MAEIDFERELEPGAETVARTSGRGSSRGLLLVFVLIGVGVLGYAWYLQTRQSSRPANNDEPFSLARSPHQMVW